MGGARPMPEQQHVPPVCMRGEDLAALKEQSKETKRIIDDLRRTIGEIQADIRQVDTTTQVGRTALEERLRSVSEAVKELGNQQETIARILVTHGDQLKSLENNHNLHLRDFDVLVELKDQLTKKVDTIDKTTKKHSRVLWKLGVYISIGVGVFTFIVKSPFFQRALQFLLQLCSDTPPTPPAAP